jgi:hypothetical protein
MLYPDQFDTYMRLLYYDTICCTLRRCCVNRMSSSLPHMRWTLVRPMLTPMLVILPAVTK